MGITQPLKIVVESYLKTFEYFWRVEFLAFLKFSKFLGNKQLFNRKMSPICLLALN